MPETNFFIREGGYKLAYIARKATASAAKTPLILFLTGFHSDMQGTKAQEIARLAEERDYDYLRFDYSGHGESEGAFRDLTLSDWLADTLAVIDHLTTKDILLVGSSMGGWLGVRAALLRPDRIKGLIGLAPAIDFTRALTEYFMTPEQKKIMAQEGEVLVSCDDGDSYTVTRKFLEDGENHLFLDKPIPLDIPVRILQGGQDIDVPWQTALKLYDQITTEDVRLELIKDAEHRLSRPKDLKRFTDTIVELCDFLTHNQ